MGNELIAGAILFGLVIGWIAHRVLACKQGPGGLSDITTLLGAGGGAGLVKMFAEGKPDIFAYYAIGLFIGFFLYFLVRGSFDFKEAVGVPGELEAADNSDADAA